MTERNAVYAGGMVGALLGAAAGYLFFTEGGRAVRERVEPAVDDLMREFHKLRRSLEKMGSMANDGLRALNEFQQARPPAQHPEAPRTSH